MRHSAVYGVQAGPIPVRRAKVCPCRLVAKDAAFSRQRSRVRIPPGTPRGHRQDGLSRLSFKEEIVSSNLTGPTKYSGFKLRWRSTRLLTGRTGFAVKVRPYAEFPGGPPGFPASSRVERTAVNRLIEVRVLGWEPFCPRREAGASSRLISGRPGPGPGSWIDTRDADQFHAGVIVW